MKVAEKLKERCRPCRDCRAPSRRRLGLTRALDLLLIAGGIEDVVHILTFQLLLVAKLVGASGLVKAVLQVRRSAQLVLAQVTLAIVNVPELIVLSNPGVGLVENTVGQEVDRGGSRKRELAGLHQAAAAVRVDGFVSGLEAAGGLDVCLFGSRVASLEIIPILEADIVGTGGVVQVHEEGRATLVGDLHAEVVAANGLRPIGKVVGVDFAAENTHGRGVVVMRGEPNLTTGSEAGAILAVAERLVGRTREGAGAGGGDGGRGNGGQQSAGGGEKAEEDVLGKHLVDDERCLSKLVGFGFQRT